MSEAAAGSQGRSPRSMAGPRPDACSVVWDNAQGSALGTAPAARFWLALEQNGPWGARAATQSHLDPDLGSTLDRMCQDAGGRFILIRRPGTHSDPPGVLPQDPPGVPPRGLPDVRPQRVYLAGGLAARPWLAEADLAGQAQLAQLALLARLDLATLGSAGIDALRDSRLVFEPSPEPVLMICTNSRRDVCCAVRGRPVALEASTQRPGQVWECSHTGGHRFAPTGVLLPYGQTFGRLSGTSAVAAIDTARQGQVPVELLGSASDRGRSHLTAPGQAAESVVRQRIQEPNLLALSTMAEPRAGQENTESSWRCRVTHVDGRRWDVLAARGSGGDDLPESCGKAPVPTWAWDCIVE